ncbi:MAG: DUF1028 domain-containing protein [Alphaproteobacteria bacterium]|nr:DUF1028 domain-containing protein [Alphaproteobacteria bacterium]
MTWSIVARDPETGAFGIAVTTRFFAVGAVCPHVMAGVGAVSTQALVNPYLGSRGIKLLAEGISANDALTALIATDEGRALRQLHLVDAKGRTAAHTGKDCLDWAGHHTGDGFSVAGNILAGERVVADTFDAYLANMKLPFAERMMTALDAGQAAGGDKRGKQSAALRIFTTEDYPFLDLRVDDHVEPLAELRRLYTVYQQDYAVFRPVVPTKANPTGIIDRQVIEEIRAKRLQRG